MSGDNSIFRTGAAFAPVFAAFRALLGDEIYALAQAHEDRNQGAYLASLLAPDSGWEVYVAAEAGTVVGFVAIQLNHERTIGELGLNAVHPDHVGAGVGTALYEFAIARMQDAGMRVATVSTGGDPSHAPARRAYENAGFTVTIPSVRMSRSGAWKIAAQSVWSRPWDTRSATVLARS